MEMILGGGGRYPANEDEVVELLFPIYKCPSRFCFKTFTFSGGQTISGFGKNLQYVQETKIEITILPKDDDSVEIVGRKYTMVCPRHIVTFFLYFRNGTAIFSL